jgi:tetratricopeptide (TPR) repeat protein
MQSRRFFLSRAATSPFSAIAATGATRDQQVTRKALNRMRSISALICALLLTANTLSADEGHHHALSEQEVGSVHFANSCSKTVQSDFQRAVALLHSFQYEQTRAAFADISKQDPQCAMAQWGVAMSHYHGLWHNGDLAAGCEALHKSQEIASHNSATTGRERAYINALSEICKQDGKDEYAHAQAFEQELGALQASYPDDTEAAVMHALMLDVTAPKTDKTFRNQRKCGEILEPIFSQQPNHPGVAHYIIHCYDNPALAEKGLRAARKYATIAPASAHANHMPSHLFTRVGSWEESIHSNVLSAELAKEAETTSTNGEARDQRLHAMDYLEYAYLQSGRVSDARSVLDEMNSLPPLTSSLTLTGDYALAAIPVRYALELGKWEDASRLRPIAGSVPWAQAITWVAVGLGAARSNDVNRAAEAEHNLAGLRDAAQQKSLYWSNQIEVQRREVAAWIAQASGKAENALAGMRSAAELEESMDKDAVTPGAVVPARELLAQLLQAQKRPQEALLDYETVLKTAPNRFNALWGAASSAESAGKANAASKYFRKLAEIGVGTERQELEMARKKAGMVARN